MICRTSGLRLAALCLIALLAAASLPAAAQEAPPRDNAARFETVLTPPPLASPRETFESFRANAQEAADSVLAALRLVEGNGTLFDGPEARALRAKGARSVLRAMEALDLSRVPPASRRNTGLAAVLMLEEIFERIPLPDPQEIPGPEAVEAGTAPEAWTVPGTPFRLVRQETLPGLSRYVFSSDSVAAIPRAYDLIRAEPSRQDDAVDFYQMYIVAPGPLVPFQVYHHILALPDWLRQVHYDQAVWQWIALTAFGLLILGVLALLRRWDRRRAVSLDARARAFSRLLLPLSILVAVFVFEYVADNAINLTGGLLANIEVVTETINTVVIAWLAILGFNLAAELVAAAPRAGAQSLDASLVRLAVRVLGFVAAGTILIYGASRIGIPVYGIVAGLGVGGLAIALAVRPTLENFIGGIILYADRPVKTGDFCRFGDMIGTVETIGLRSTRIRALDRTLITVQNAEFAQMRIVNFTRRDQNLLQTTIHLRYETTVEELSAVIAALEDMLRTHPKVDHETVRVRFRALATYSLEIEIWAYVLEPVWPEFLKVTEELLLETKRIVEESGQGFALPSRTTYLASDRSLAGEGRGAPLDMSALARSAAPAEGPSGG